MKVDTKEKSINMQYNSNIDSEGYCVLLEWLQIWAAESPRFLRR